MRNKIILIFIFILLLVGCKDNHKYKGYTIEISYCGTEEQINSDDLFFTNFQEFDKYMSSMKKCGTEEIRNKYGEEYFKENSLAIIYTTTNNGSYRIEYENYEIIDDKIKINYNKKSLSNIGTTEMHGYYVVVEVPKMITGLVKKDYSKE